MIGAYFDSTATVKRLATTTGAKKEYTDHLTGVACHVQPQDAETNVDMEGSYGKAYIMFCGDVDIQEQDHVTVGSVTYKVMGVERLSFIGNAHLEVTLRAFV